MKRSLVISMMIVSALMSAGCAIKHAELAVAGTKKFDLNMQEFEKVGENVTGQSVSHMIIFFPTRKATIEEAIQDALKKVDGDIMTDVVIYQKFWTAVLYDKAYFEVKGTALKLKSKPQNSSDMKN